MHIKFYDDDCCMPQVLLGKFGVLVLPIICQSIDCFRVAACFCLDVSLLSAYTEVYTNW